MSSFHRKIVSLAIICSFWACVAFATPQDDFLQIYLAIQEADQLVQSGQSGQGREKYVASLNQLEKLQSKYPDWEPVIVRYRINFCKQKIAKLAHASSVSGSGNHGSEKSNQTAGSAAGESPIQDAASLRAKVEELQGELTHTKKQLAEAKAEAADLRARQKVLEQQIVNANQSSQTSTVQNSSNEKQLTQLLEENKSLRTQLEQTKADLTQAKGGDFAALQTKLQETQEKLTATLSQVETLQKSGESYQQQLEEAKAELAKSQAKGDVSTESSSNAEERRVLRQVVERALENEAKRDSAKRLAMAEMASLKIEAQTLKNQIDILASPVLNLTPAERELLKLPEAGLVIDEGGHISTTIQSADTSEYSTKPKVPEEFREHAEKAAKFFSERKFEDALTQYQAILKAYPTSLYALSNLGVVKFQQQKYAEAEQYLRQAVRQASQDAFCHSILGIVLYQQGRYDEAVELLTRAVALDPNDPKTRNYLGISASQKGWQEVAKRECLKAVELDDKYADAHFNLAVIYTTEKPPARELAQKHYKRALELGVPPDKALEEFLK